MHVPTLCDWFGSSGTGTLFSLDHKLYASEYDSDSDSVASENQPLTEHSNVLTSNEG